MNLNFDFDHFLENIQAITQWLGPGIPILAWLSVLAAVIGMGQVLKKYSLETLWPMALLVGGVSLSAHMLDYFITLRMSPDLAEELNPLWRVIIDNCGLPIAKAYGLSGKILLGFLSLEFYLYYLVKRRSLFPHNSKNFFSFWRDYGRNRRKKTVLRFKNIINFFSFAYAFTGPFYFYVALKNSLIGNSAYELWPSLPSILVFYLTGVLVAYFYQTYHAYRFKHPY